MGVFDRLRLAWAALRGVPLRHAADVREAQDARSDFRNWAMEARGLLVLALAAGVSPPGCARWLRQALTHLDRIRDDRR